MQPTLSHLGIATLLLTLGLGALWVGTFLRFTLGRWVQRLLVLCGLLAILALVTLGAGDGVLDGLVALGALLAAVVYAFVHAIAPQPQRRHFSVGDRLPPIRLPDADGAPVDLAAIDGPVLLKVFRGYWCPFCVAELHAWASLLPELHGLGVAFVALSPDTVPETRLGRELHGWTFPVLSDHDLAVTEALGLRSNKTLAIGPGRSIARVLAVPTTILVDRDGVVRWIDQATDYRVRSDPSRVLPAVREALATMRAESA